MIYIGIGLLIFAVLLFLFWKVVFLRNPRRTTPHGNHVVAPADGRIIEIFEFKGEDVKLFKGNQRLLGLIHTLTADVAKEGYIVSVFMSPMDVHINRAPITGTVESVIHTSGKFLNVSSFEAGLVNEKAETIIKGAITVKMIQIAGFLARRVVTNVNPDDTVEAGQEIGLINLGSQVTMILPKSVTLQVKKGDRTVAGETILAKIN